MENKKNLFIVILVTIVLAIILIFIKLNEVRIENIEFNNLNTIVSKSDTFILYVGEVDNNVKSNMKTFKKKYKVNLYKTSADLNQLNEYLLISKIEINKLPVYIVFERGEVLGIMYENDNHKELLDKYLYNKIPESEVAYKVLTKSDDYIKKVNSKKYTVAVFGYESCSYCNLYLPIFNKVAHDKNIDIYYFDRDNYDINEWDNIMDLDLTIPAECTSDNKETTFLQGFPKPMTIITKSGKVVGCIKGYITEDVLIDKLKEFKIIKEK